MGIKGTIIKSKPWQKTHPLDFPSRVILVEGEKMKNKSQPYSTHLEICKVNDLEKCKKNNIPLNNAKLFYGHYFFDKSKAEKDFYQRNN